VSEKNCILLETAGFTPSRKKKVSFMEQCKRISVLGSTGSIGRQSLEVIAACGMTVAALTGNTNVALMEEQARKVQPELAVLADEKAAADLRVRLADTNVKVLSGIDGVLEAAAIQSADTVISSLVGMVGLRPTLTAIREGRRVALANKETLVCAGPLVFEEAKDYGSRILPVDSEHSALFQCLEGNRDRGEVKRLILTCSGGPFYGKKAAELKGMTREDALQHPNWSMGAKITVDSATLMNKGLEIIEAMHLYKMPPEKISVVIHRESIIHSLVEYCDNAMIAQLGAPDMRLPIQFALTWPKRVPGPSKPLDLWNCGPLTFGTPDMETFRCLALAIQAAKTGGSAGAILNGANEAAVGQFLAGEIGFLDIADRVAYAMETVPVVKEPGLTDILEADQAARDAVLSMGR
jgi:1-deoxy-D-xylulose-5-phosphate reductoisomerase